MIELTGCWNHDSICYKQRAIYMKPEGDHPMELKQMEYLVTAVESRSLSKAAEILYTSQPNVSKVLKNLEKELSVKILKRSSKGVTLTPVGEQIYGYAKNMLKTARIIEEISGDKVYKQLKIASYPSKMIASKLTQYYIENDASSLHIEYLAGTVEEVVEYICMQNANVGIIYYLDHQEHAFNQILKRKDLVFKRLKKCSYCLYVGPKHPYYERDITTYESLKNLKYVQGKKDYFCLSEHIDVLSKGIVTEKDMKHLIHTNSERVMLNMLSHTDLCNIGLDLVDSEYIAHRIRKIEIEGATPCLNAGYIKRANYTFSNEEEEFIKLVADLFMQCRS